ncbi:alkylhydroperoxidase AhpD family core domain-containing protein [Octadecabacter temperatus]|uniref:Carboxymuconolactone decarboxylase family protein n=1 Tax=Octadecabacter temperatus TaxID=1458307 RepID=A0A0K0Y8I6_9RHOB|nr:carboxymuconolactone decarboxylase family protein [Octadecabacter temperatus]AKS47192.1 Carboxymuconolactone decarboxylase family protein [Octadecabacter temperatus]SIO45465.1 alkylhydroperoxidase AhpD family core domain-containing protein [Octadecabacter temperatus]
MSQRLTGLSHEEATGTTKMVYEGSDRFLGRTANLQRILGTHSPYIARWFGGFVAAVRQPDLGATTDPRLRGLASIKTSMVNACEYCTAHTSVFGQGLGISDEELEAMMTDAYKTSPLFDERDRAAIAWAEAMTNNTAQRDKNVWEVMKANFTEAEIVEISLAAGMFNMINRLNDSFWTTLESPEHNKRQWNAVEGLSVDEIEAFAGKFAEVGAAERKV